jgi:hypothetical protein
MYAISVRKLERKRPFRRLERIWRIILKIIVKERGVNICSEFIWFSTGTSGRLLTIWK